MNPCDQQTRAHARLKSYTWHALMVFILYWFLWLPGYIANWIFYGEAQRMERLAGEHLPGAGCLWFLLWLNNIVLGLLLLVGLLSLAPALTPPSDDSTSRQPPNAAVPAPAARGLVSQYAGAVRSFNPRLTDDWDRRLAGAIIHSSSRQRIDSRLLLAVMAVESNFDIGAHPEAKIARQARHLRQCLQRLSGSPAAPASADELGYLLTDYGMRTSDHAQVWRLFNQFCGKA